jgi:outer membrane receptor for monomeric catechols
LQSCVDWSSQRIQLHLAGKPEPDDPWNGAISRNYAGTDTKADTYALYAFDTLELSEQWLVNMGLRYDHFDTSYKTYTNAGTTTSKGDDVSEFVTGQFGVLVWKPARTAASMRPTRRPPPHRARPSAKVRKATRWAARLIATATC